MSARKLPVDMSVEAVNARLLSGDLEAWRDFAPVDAQLKPGTVNTIYLLAGQYWLSFTDDELGDGAVEVDVAKSTIANDPTGRVFLTGLDIPRYTNIALATTGSGPYPIQTRPLGVPGPLVAPTVNAELGATPAIDIFDDFAALSQAQWVLVPTLVGPFTIRRAEFLTNSPDDTARLWLTAQETTAGGAGPVYAYRDFGIGSSAQIDYSFDWTLEQAHAPYAEFTANAYVGCSELGAGPLFLWGTNGPGVYVAGYAIGSSWTSPGGALSTVNMPWSPSFGVVYRVRITGSRRANGSYDFRFTISQGSTVVVDIPFSNIPISGGFCGHGILGSLNADRGPDIQTVDRVLAQGSAPADDPTDNVATNYVFTFVNDIGEESAPSEPSATIFKDDGTTVTIVTSTAPPSGIDYFITTKRIYRAVTGGAGTEYKFVAEIPLAQDEYVDTLTDAQLGESLLSAGWDLPPANLRGILALPNDIYVGFFDNALCLSAQGRPHAWPVAFRLATDEPIVCIGNVDNNVVIFTEAFQYLAAGNSPEAFSMVKFTLPQGAVSKASLAYLDKVGVVAATPDGALALSGTGASAMLTQALYSRKEWQALNPSTMVAAAHDDRLFLFYEAAGVKRGIMLGLGEDGFGVVTLAFHARAIHVDPLTDRMYLVLDANDPPVFDTGTAAPNPTGAMIYEYDAASAGPLPYRWRSKLFMVRGDIPRYAKVRASSYEDLQLNLYADGALYDSITVLADAPFPLARPPEGCAGDTWQCELIGKDAVQAALFGYDADDFADGP